MNANRDNQTGHLLACPFIQHPNRGFGGTRYSCSTVIHTGQNCGGTLSKQACGYRLCTSRNNHWRVYCESRVPQWHYELSACANERADELGMSYDERRTIDQFNIEAVLGLPADYEFNHISDGRREAVDDAAAFDPADDDAPSSDNDAPVDDAPDAPSSDDGPLARRTRSKRRRLVEPIDEESDDETSSLDGFIVDDMMESDGPTEDSDAYSSDAYSSDE